MSHTTTLKNVAIRDVQAMHQAVAELQQAGVNCELVEGGSPRMYSSNQKEECAYVLHLKDGQYDVGFQTQDDGTLSPVLDVWGNHVAGQIGAACPMPNSNEGRAQATIGKFMQSYSKNAAVNAAIAQGYTVESIEYDAEGLCHVTVGGIN